MAQVVKITKENENKYFFDFNEKAILSGMESAIPQLESWGVIPKQSPRSKEKIASTLKILSGK